MKNRVCPDESFSNKPDLSRSPEDWLKDEEDLIRMLGEPVKIMPSGPLLVVSPSDYKLLESLGLTDLDKIITHITFQDVVRFSDEQYGHNSG